MNTILSLRNLKPVNLLLISLGAYGVWEVRLPLWHAIAMIGDPQAIISYLRSFENYGLAVLSGLMVAQVFLALIPGQALIVAAGYLYGASTTFAVVAITTIFGSQLAFGLARRFGRPLIYRIASPKAVDYWDRKAGHLGPSFYFLTFLLPVFPSDMMCYVAGLGKVTPRGFFAANCAGRTIAALTYTLLGSYSFQPPIWFWVTVGVGLAIILTVWFIYKRKHLRNDARNSTQANS